MKIGNIETKNNIFLAPMAGVNDMAFRQICSMFGAGLTYTEMISVKGLLYKSKNTLKLLKQFEGESPSVVQIFGHEPEVFEQVLKSGILDSFDIIDINMGCPAPKIVKNGDGSALLKNIELARAIISTCVKSTNKPITVKFRKGFKANDDILVEFAKMCEDAGASAITVHPRTTSQGYSGKIDILDIKKVKQSVKIPVIGNGDVVDEVSFEQMLTTGCDGVMIGRKAVGEPDIFDKLQGKKILPKQEIAKIHLDLLKKYYLENYITKTFKRHAMGYVDNLLGASEMRKKIALANKLSDIENVLFNK